MDCSHVGDNIEIAFNCRYFISSVRVIDCDKIKITLKGSTLPMTLEPSEKDDKFASFYMIVPMRMREQ
jgi:DNA polymerase III sliding clamp (beta) subunit (PCNA family)